MKNPGATSADLNEARGRIFCEGKNTRAGLADP